MKRFYLFAAALLVVAACEKENGKDKDKTTDPITEITYAGETYKVVTLADGSIWMAENLRYVPEGKTVSEDPAENAGIWYPYEVKDGKAVALKDEASIKKYGYLYDIETAFGATLNKENAGSFEGTRGICPEGWHVPTRADFLSIVGYSLRGDNDEGPVINENAPYYDAELGGAKVVVLDEAGFNHSFAGMISRTSYQLTGKYMSTVVSEKNSIVKSYYGRNAMSNYIGSTFHKVVYSDSDPELLSYYEYWGLTTSFILKTAPEGKFYVSKLRSPSGMSLRCVKD